MSDEQKSAKLKCFFRIMNLITAAVIIGFGIAGIILMSLQYLTNGKFFLFFSPAFMILFGIMILVAEFEINFLMDVFSFLNYMMGRGVFNIFLASNVFYYFTYAGQIVLGWIVAVVLFVLGLLYIGLGCCGGKEWKRQEKDTKQQMM